MCKHRGDAPLGNCTVQRRHKRPPRTDHDGGACVGRQDAGSDVTGDKRHRHGESEQCHDHEVGAPPRERTQNAHQPSESVGSCGDSTRDVTPRCADRIERFGDGRGHRDQRSPGQRGGTQKTATHNEPEHRCERGPPHRGGAELETRGVVGRFPNRSFLVALHRSAVSKVGRRHEQTRAVHRIRLRHPIRATRSSNRADIESTRNHPSPFSEGVRAFANKPPEASKQ